MGRVKKMGKKVFIIDVERCVACYNCFIACKDEFVDHAWLPYSEAQPDHGHAFIAVNEVEQGRFPKVRVRYIPTSNNYGDFEFEGIEVGTEYSLRIEAEGYYPVTIENLETKQDIYLDEIVLQKSV
jgi:hypothetical protein